MGKLIKKLSTIFTKNEQSELGYLLGSVDNSLNSVKSSVDNLSTIQANINSATGEWLDEWGIKFGVIRFDKETDNPYRIRILAEVTNPKGTLPALRAAVERALGAGSVLGMKETYEDLRIFNVSTFSGTGKFQDSDTVRLAVVQIYINKPENDRLREEIWKTRASGTKVIIIQGSPPKTS